MNPSLRHAIFRVVLPYMVFASLWILLSDELLAALLTDPTAITQWSIYKGLAFVVVTGLLLSALLRVEVWARERSEAALRKSEEAIHHGQALLQAITDGTSDAVYVKDTQGVYLMFNSGACRAVGKPREEVLGKDDAALFSPEDARQVMEGDRHVLESAITQTYEELVSIGGVLHTFLSTKGPIRDQQGKIIGLFGIARDITDRKQYEERLRESERKYRELVECANSIILRWGHDGKVIYLNEFGQRFFGYAEAEICGRHVIGTIVPETDLRGMNMSTLMDQICSNPAAYEQNINENMRRNGERVWIAWTNRIVFDEQGKVKEILSVGSDITARKRAEEERDALQAQLIQSQKLESIGTLASGVAHEINNPIMGIQGYAQMIQDNVDPQSTAAEYAEGIVKASQRVTTIVKNLLSFARVDKQPHQPARICDIVEGTLSLIRTVLRHDQVVLEVQVPDSLPPIECRAQQIQQVIMNLLTNARDALNDRYPEFDQNKKVIISARELSNAERKISITDGHMPRAWVRLTVEDHGMGIPDALRDRIVDPFFTTKPRDKGTGLGLSISHGIVKDHGGVLWFESEVGHWTRVHVDLPTISIG